MHRLSSASLQSSGRACHLDILLLGADVQDGAQLPLGVGLRGDDQQPVQQVDGDAVRGPGPPQATQSQSQPLLINHCGSTEQQGRSSARACASHLQWHVLPPGSL